LAPPTAAVVTEVKHVSFLHWRRGRAHVASIPGRRGGEERVAVETTAQNPTYRQGLTGAPPPPLSRGWPIIGHLPDLLRDPLPLLLEKHRELGACFGIRAAGRVWTCLAGPDANALLGREAYDYLETGEEYRGFNEAFRSDWFIISLDGKPHAHLRRIVKKPFSREALARKLPETIALTEKRIAGWGDGTEVDIVRELKALVVAQIGVTLVGRDASELLDDLQTLMNHIVSVTQLKIWPRFLLKMPPFVRAHERLYADTRRVVDARRRAPSPPGQEDLVDEMLAARDLEGRPMPEDAILAATAGAYLAGLDTAAISAAFILYGLLKHRAAYMRVIEEVDAFFAGPPTWERLSQMGALRGACMEAFRMWPVAALVPRNAACDFEFAGKQVKKGDLVFVVTAATHFDPRYYRDPEKYDIDRFAPPREEHKPAGAYAPFGLGPHKCLGANMGELQAMITVATMLHRLRLVLAPSNYELKIVAKPIRRPDARFRVRVIERRRPRVPYRTAVSLPEATTM
jgi:cytochrome P450